MSQSWKSGSSEFMWNTYMYKIRFLVPIFKEVLESKYPTSPIHPSYDPTPERIRPFSTQPLYYQCPI